MDLLERAIFLLIGGGVGFILGYIVARLREIKEEVDEVLDIEKGKASRARGEEGFMRVPLVADIMYLTVLALVLYGVYLSIQASNDIKANAKEDQISRCEAGVDNRNVQRELVEAVYNLATGAAQRRPEEPALSGPEAERYNDYIREVNAFRENMYDKIVPSEECAPFVEDDNVDPPTKAFPTIETPDAGRNQRDE